MESSIQELLDRLQTCDECRRIEAKECKNSLGKSVRETISAFSNEPGLRGGYLVLGISRNESDSYNKRYTIIGISDPDKIQGELASTCSKEFNIQIRPEIHVEIVENKPIVVAFISEASLRDKPVFIRKLGLEKGTFRRIGSSDQRCTRHDLDLLYQLRSAMPYENEVLNNVSWKDIDIDAIADYRRQRALVDPEAAELRFDDKKLLEALCCLDHNKEGIVPNVAGLLLFGRKEALRRMLPTDARVDYVITEGPKWIRDPSARHYSIDYRESLITLLPRLHAQIMGDLPKLFALETGKLQRTDKTTIPRNVIREALSNLLMHRDYRAGQPTLVIRYSNRLEFKNAGYSLKPFDDLGQPG
jgi:ATP-dependent DNA helicase RecG